MASWSALLSLADAMAGLSATAEVPSLHTLTRRPREDIEWMSSHTLHRLPSPPGKPPLCILFSSLHFPFLLLKLAGQQAVEHACCEERARREGVRARRK